MTEMLLYFDMKVATPNGFIPESRGLLKHARLKAGCFVGTSVFLLPRLTPKYSRLSGRPDCLVSVLREVSSSNEHRCCCWNGLFGVTRK